MKKGITIKCETGNVEDLEVVNNESGEPITGISKIELSPIQEGSVIMARVTFSKVCLRLAGHVVSVKSANSGSIE